MRFHTWRICGAACLLLLAAGNIVSAQDALPATELEQAIEGNTAADMGREDDMPEGEEPWYSFYDELFEEDGAGVAENTDAVVPDVYAPNGETASVGTTETYLPNGGATAAGAIETYLPDGETADTDITDAFASDGATSNAGISDAYEPDSELTSVGAAYTPESETWDAVESNSYLPVEFVEGISTLTWFPEDAAVEEAVQGGQRMIKLCPKDISEKGSLGVRYGKIAQKDDTWYDLKITVADFETEHRITKEGEVDVYPTVAFCKTQIAWGRPEAVGKITLKMEFVENGTDNVRPFGSGMQWTITDALAPVAQESVSVLQGIRQGALQQIEKTLITVRHEPQVRLFVAEYERAARRWTQNTVFQVYEWNGREYAAYRGSLAYDGERKLYVMEQLVRSSLNQGRYKVVREADGWEQEFLVPDLPVVTDLYYHIEA